MLSAPDRHTNSPKESHTLKHAEHLQLVDATPAATSDVAVSKPTGLQYKLTAKLAWAWLCQLHTGGCMISSSAVYCLAAFALLAFGACVFCTAP